MLQRFRQALQARMSSVLMSHGLVGWRYLWPGGDQRIRMHRLLWWRQNPAMPRPLWLVIELASWFHWVGFGLWRATALTVVKRGDELQQDAGLSRVRQILLFLRLGLMWCIPPHEVCRYQLWRNPGQALDYLYDAETRSYHAWRSQALEGGAYARQVLSDKLAFEELAKRHHLPIVETRVVAGATNSVDFERWLASGMPLFCKSRRGNRGRGAFAVWQAADGPCGQGFNGKALNGMVEIQSAWNSLCVHGDILIQPRLRTDPQLLACSQEWDVVTLRLISRFLAGNYEALLAVLEVPHDYDPATGVQRYACVPIDLGSGCLHAGAGSDVLSAAAKRHNREILKQLGDRFAVPGWATMVDESLRAHRLLPGLWAVAWDWAITDKGPVLLEGNSGWEAGMLQQLDGGLLAQAQGRPD